MSDARPTEPLVFERQFAVPRSYARDIALSGSADGTVMLEIDNRFVDGSPSTYEILTLAECRQLRDWLTEWLEQKR